LFEADSSTLGAFRELMRRASPGPSREPRSAKRDDRDALSLKAAGLHDLPTGIGVAMETVERATNYTHSKVGLHWSYAHAMCSRKRTSLRPWEKKIRRDPALRRRHIAALAARRDAADAWRRSEPCSPKHGSANASWDARPAPEQKAMRLSPPGPSLIWSPRN